MIFGYRGGRPPVGRLGEVNGRRGALRGGHAARRPEVRCRACVAWGGGIPQLLLESLLAETGGPAVAPVLDAAAGARANPSSRILLQTSAGSSLAGTSWIRRRLTRAQQTT